MSRWHGEARLPDGGAARPLARAGRGLGGERGLRDARGRLLAGRRRREAALRGRHAHRRRLVRPGRGARASSTATGSRSPRSPTTRTTSTRTTRTAPRSTPTCARSSTRPPLLGVDVVGTFVGNDKDRPLTENLRALPADLARPRPSRERPGREDRDRELPDDLLEDEWPCGNNLAWSPRIWEQMFEVIPDEGFGLNLDPSHLVWLMIDYERVVYDFADRIFHVHAKDMEIGRDGLYRHGTFSAGHGLAGAAAARPRRGALGALRLGALRGRLRPLDLDRARGPRASRATRSSSSAAS